MKTDKDLYIMGEIIDGDELAVAIVGTRTPSEYGLRMAKRFSAGLAKRRVTVISGLARGIDTAAHKAAIAAGGRTIAVLGSGLDIIYPPENKELAREIAANGAVITAFPPGTKPLGKNFLARNSLIAGLSRAVLVVEGRRKSGTISTATHAANLSRHVFAVPGKLDSPLSEAPNYLIREGAHLARSVDDILDTIL